MLIAITALLLLPGLGAATESDCEDFTVASCQPDSSQIIQIIPFTYTLAKCEDYCQIQEDCKSWILDTKSKVCSLLKYNYLNSCNFHSGSRWTNLSKCLARNSGDCQDLVDENCLFSGKAVFTAKVRDEQECISFLNQLGPPVTSANYYSYSFNDQEQRPQCILYNSSNRTCSSMSGPSPRQNANRNLTIDCESYIDDSSDCSTVTVGSCFPDPSQTIMQFYGVRDFTHCEKLCKYNQVGFEILQSYIED